MPRDRSRQRMIPRENVRAIKSRLISAEHSLERSGSTRNAASFRERRQYRSQRAVLRDRDAYSVRNQPRSATASVYKSIRPYSCQGPGITWSIAPQLTTGRPFRSNSARLRDFHLRGERALRGAFIHCASYVCVCVYMYVCV